MAANCIFACGGTFDKIYDPIRETLGFDGSSAVPMFLQDARVSGWDFVQLFQIDSLDILEEHRRLLLDELARAKYDRVVIVHGTSRMAESARYVSGRFPGSVVFTGALVPYRYSPIEAAANLGGALIVAQLAQPGTYIYMNGSIFDPYSCQKDPNTGLFQHAP